MVVSHFLDQNFEAWRNEQSPKLGHVVRSNSSRNRQGKEKACGIIRTTENEQPPILEFILILRLWNLG